MVTLLSQGQNGLFLYTHPSLKGNGNRLLPIGIPAMIGKKYRKGYFCSLSKVDSNICLIVILCHKYFYIYIFFA